MNTQNNNFRVEPFKTYHFQGIYSGMPGWVMFENDVQFTDYLVGLEKHPGYCAFHNDKLVGAAGIIIPYRGVGEAWAFVLPGARECVRDFQKAVKRGLRQIARENALHRIEANVLQDFNAGRRWAVSLGFKPEAVRHKAGPNKENLIHFAMFPEGQ